jgi:integrase
VKCLSPSYFVRAFKQTTGIPSPQEQPRHDLKRPWDAVIKQAGLIGVRLHDLRHTYASFGAGSGLGLPIIGRLLGHAQATTTARYAHLDSDPLRHASDAIAGRIAAALEGNREAIVLPFRGPNLGA